MNPWNKPFSERIANFNNPIAKRLLAIAESKQSNLVLSADLTSQDELLTLADRLGPKIAMLKTHIDIVSDFEPSLIAKLKELSQRHNFLLFEDRKFADIGKTVVEQCRGGMYRISSWADVINAHIVSGPGIIGSLQMACQEKSCLLLLIAELSAKDTLADSEYHQHALAFREVSPDFACGFISQKRLPTKTDLLYLSPGVHLSQSGDELDQQYRGPEQAIVRDQADFIIVGRGITQDGNPEVCAERYRQAAWEAYQQRL